MKVKERFKNLYFHDSLLKSVNIDFNSKKVIFELDYVVNLMETTECDYKAYDIKRKPAELILIDFKKIFFNIESDIVNPEIILEIELKETSDLLNEINKKKNDVLFHFHIYTTSNSTIDVLCKDFIFNFKK